MNALQLALLELYKEHAAQARQHETQRERMTGAVVAIGAAVTAFLAQALKDPSLALVIPAVFLVPLGCFGALFSRKHYERNRHHTAIMSAYLTALQAQIAGSDLHGPRKLGRAENEAQFGRLAKWRLYLFWDALNASVAVVGVVLTIVIVVVQQRS